MSLIAGAFPVLAFAIGFLLYYVKRMVWTPTLVVLAGSVAFLMVFSVAFQAYVLWYVFLCWLGCWSASWARQWNHGRRKPN
jgi:putative effector of murein hydrolase